MNIGEARERIKELELVYEMQYSILEDDNHIKNKEALELVLNELDKKDNQIKQLNNRCKNLDREAQSYLEELAGDSGLKDRTIQMQDKVIDMMAEEILIRRAYAITCEEDIQKLKERIIEEYYEKVRNKHD